MDRIELLKGIQKPGRYTGGEWNSIHKTSSSVKARIALAFPDIYEIGMSYLGQKILYSDINAHPDYAAERVFTPWTDFEKRLRETNFPLCSLESNTPLHKFDIIGFSLLYELNYSNVLTILDLGGIPLKSRDRNSEHPLVIAGGPAAFNPEPVAEIFDAFLIGDGEEAVFEILALWTELSNTNIGEKRTRRISRLAEIKGIYVPGLYRVREGEKRASLLSEAVGDAPPSIKKRVVHPFKQSAFPSEIIVPNISSIFDRVSVEAERGCPERCRFCQASSIYFPPRAKNPGDLVETVKNSLNSTGYNEASLAALSIGDYPYIHQVLATLMNQFEKTKISMSLSSLRPKSLTKDIAENIVRVRKTGFTLVPEAGTERLRCVINKSLTDEEIREAVQNAFSEGWRLIKLYFMVGLPTETASDLDGIVDTVETIIRIGYEIMKKAPQINLSISSFIPKPHTPFQWEAMDSLESMKEKHGYIRSRLKKYRFIKFNKVNFQASLLEAVFSRGDRRLNDVLVEAWKQGARFESWDEQFDFKIWEQAFDKMGIDYSMFLDSPDYETVLPWDHIETGIPKRVLWEERQKAYSEERTASCLHLKCSECGRCSLSAEYEKEFPPREIDPVPIQEPIGEKTESGIRYRVVYAKIGPARFYGHNDLNNTIQRTLRRASVEVRFSQGFHPKMLISYLPALPLGMEGHEEVFEFQSNYDMDESELIRVLNQFSPKGLSFLEASKISPSGKSLFECVEHYVYSVDLKDLDIRKAMSAFSPSGSEKGSPDLQDKIKIYFEKWKARGLKDIRVIEDGQSLEIFILAGLHGSIRAQDVVKELFEIPYPAFALSRKRVVFKPDEKCF